MTITEPEEVRGELATPKAHRRIVIKHEHLPDEVRENINVARIGRFIRRKALGGGVNLGIAAVVGAYVASSSPIISVLLGLGTAGATIPGALAANKAIYVFTSGVGAKIHKHGLVAAEHKKQYDLPKMEKLRETHPLFIVDLKGNIHLIPRSKFEESLKKAQKTFLKHILPFRYRSIY